MNAELLTAFNQAMEMLGEDILDDLDANQIEALDNLRTAIADSLPHNLAAQLFELY